ncbi:hypothetical protein [Cupriavidus taiwanensis]|uniref:hypothetical protein n=1 Tax=Cupriavidus taiwanensis TaxID=164546 RepID=UPI000E1621DF|nr:hypothetical protein [Cupriavidus taiwanensis]SPA44616.1 hypothetical protein CBM2629_A150418 [Cupriavidus taiwanensis]
MDEREAREFIRYKLRVKYGSLRNYATYRGVTAAAISKALLHSAAIPDWLLAEAGLTRVVEYREVAQ